MSKLLLYLACALKLGSEPREKWRLLWYETKNLRVRLRLARHRPGREYTIRTRYRLLHFRDNFGDITNVPGLLCREVYRPRSPLGDGCILDVGANVGLAAAYFAHELPGHAIHCFEPIADNVRMIRLNCPAAVTVQAAVGARPQRVTLQVDRDDVIASSIATAWKTRPMEVDVITLDAYAREQQIEKVAYLKIDTEGMELNVLEGAKEVLRRTAQVVLETHGQERHTRTIALLRDAGFDIDHSEWTGKTGMVFAVRPSANLSS